MPDLLAELAGRTAELRPEELAEVARVPEALPAVLNGLFQVDLGPTSSQLTWISTSCPRA